MDIVVVGEQTLFTLREQGTVRVQKMLGYQPACACKYTVVASPGEQGAALVGTTVDEADESFATIVEEENLIIATDSDQLMVLKVRANQYRHYRSLDSSLMEWYCIGRGTDKLKYVIEYLDGKLTQIGPVLHDSSTHPMTTTNKRPYGQQPIRHFNARTGSAACVASIDR